MLTVYNFIIYLFCFSFLFFVFLYVCCFNPSSTRWPFIFVSFFFSFFFNCILGFGVHVKNMQGCCMGTHMAVWFAAFLPITYIWHFSPCYLSPTPHLLLSLPYLPPTDPSVWCFPPCVHVFSLFNTHLWVRTCAVWFSVLVLVCQE